MTWQGLCPDGWCYLGGWDCATHPKGNMEYTEFVESKRITSKPSGFAVKQSDLNPMLFGYQKKLVEWSLARGKAAIFAECGLGKTPMQLEWASHVALRTGKPVLVLAPLAVSAQTIREGEKFGIEVRQVANQDEIGPGINITNYEKLHHFSPEGIGGIVIDESSCLKSFGGVTRKAITEFASGIPYRLACTATPAPNDLIEITNHAEFLSVMNGKEIIALFFTQDGNTTHKWRLKGHARDEFWKWLASWSVAVRKPSDIGFPDDGFDLPELRPHQIIVECAPIFGTLFSVHAATLEDQRKARRASLQDRVNVCAEMVNNSAEPWLVWCDLNSESEALRKAIPDAVEVSGSDPEEHKIQSAIGFITGKIRVLVSKPSIFGFGMNFQHCCKTAFVGLSHSWEAYYQATRRVWRYGQTKPVDAYVITSEEEGAVVANINRKEVQAREMMDELVNHMGALFMESQSRNEMTYRETTHKGKDYTLYLGDSVLRMDEIETESVGLTVTSPPFPGMYTYTNSAHDIGNTETIDQMIEHFKYLVGKDKLLRVTMPGRMCCIHLMQLTAMKSREGYIGLHDYRGRVISMMIEAGWRYAGEVTIDKNPQIQATRNKERGLLFKSLATDASMMRMALADYLIYFRKDGQNPKPIKAGISKRYNAGAGWITEAEWIEWAAPVWYRQIKNYPGGIRETDVLNVVQARETNDERHLCSLQLGVIERAVKLWSAPGDLVFDPFNGIGSTGHEALRLNRRYVGCELKESYFKSAILNLERGLAQRSQGGLFDAFTDEEVA